MDSTSVAQAWKPFNGSILMAVNTTWLLYGCYLIQTYHYFTSPLCSNDYYFRILVITITFAGAMHVGFGTATQWGILVEHWGDEGVWTNTPWSSSLGPFTSGLNGFLVQLFFVSRILLLSRHFMARISAAVITLASMLAISGSIAIMILFLEEGSNALEVVKLQPVMRLWSISTVTCDVLIASTMSLILFYARNQTRYKSTRNLLQSLIIQSIETGTITAVTMLLFLVCYETMHSNSVYMLWEFSSGPLYGNVLVFVLNSRYKTMLKVGVGKRDDSNGNNETSHPITLTSPSSIVISRDMSLATTGWTKSSEKATQLDLESTMIASQSTT